MPYECPDPSQNSGNLEENQIPNKIGEPLSNACDRSHTIGSIPEVIRHPAFTLVDGGAVAGRPSNGGIQNMASFFKPRHGCYYDKDAKFSGSTCE
jgi:hypothetical protein